MSRTGIYSKNINHWRKLDPRDIAESELKKKGVLVNEDTIKAYLVGMDFYKPPILDLSKRTNFGGVKNPLPDEIKDETRSLNE